MLFVDLLYSIRICVNAHGEFVIASITRKSLIEVMNHTFIYCDSKEPIADKKCFYSPEMARKFIRKLKKLLTPPPRHVC